MTPELLKISNNIKDISLSREFTLATAESCTGGLIAAVLTEVAGSSDYFLGGCVAYSNAVKSSVLSVDESVLAAHGAVSGPVVEAMARGACQLIGASHSMAVSGVAGPSGGSQEKPVGTVWIGWAAGNKVWSERYLFPGDRSAVREATALAALEGLAGVL